MARFNTTADRPTVTTNLAGGEAYTESPKLELASLVLTSLVNDQYYRKASDAIEQTAKLVDACGPEYSAKVALFARHEFGLRSISHVVAGEVARHRFPGKRDFFASIPRRVDDISEILSYYFSRHAKASSKEGRKHVLPKAMQRGLADSLNRFDAYQLAKYRGEGRGMSLIDVVNLLHPKPTVVNAEAMAALMKDALRSDDTWEALLSAAGKDEDKRSAAWATLLSERKLGYLALLKNLRNIHQQAQSATVEVALEQLTHGPSIQRSLVLPFRFITASRELEKLSDTKDVLNAVARAANISVQNIPQLPGRTLVAIDVSGSMDRAIGGNKETTCMDVAIMFGAALAQKQNVEVMAFTDDAQYISLRGIDLFGDIQTIKSKVKPLGTNFHSIFQTANKPYDQIVILSDMQAWMSSADGYYNTNGNPRASFADYRAKHSCNPRVFSFDLTGYGSLQFPEQNVYALAGFSDRVFDVMALLQEDRNALVNRIESYAPKLRTGGIIPDAEETEETE